MTNLHELRKLAREAAYKANENLHTEQPIEEQIADAVLLVVTQYVEQHEKEKNHGAALLPGDPLASPPTTEALPNSDPWAEVARLLNFGEMHDPWVLVGALQAHFKMLEANDRNADE